MKSLVQSVRGMRDILPDDQALFTHIVRLFETFSHKYNYSPMSTPIIEYEDLFIRSLGATSDCVSKEMYRVSPSSSNRNLVLRPEGTAGILRALLSSGKISASTQSNHKVSYVGPMFRHERPQLGRYRQFMQAGVENVGGIHDVNVDIETIMFANAFLTSVVNSNNYRITCKVNSLGNSNELSQYSSALSDYFTNYRASLSLESQARLDRGAPLRILDSKSDIDQEFIRNAPTISAFWTIETRNRIESVLRGLQDAGIAYEMDYRLVRGLDYYRHTIFEYVLEELEVDSSINGTLGANLGTVLAGGRYDGFVELFSGPPDIQGIGWAAGVDRLCQVARPNEGASSVDVVIAPFSDDLQILDRGYYDSLAMSITAQVRNEINARVERFSCGSSLKKQLSLGSKLDAKVAVIIGPDERKDGKFSVKSMKEDGNQTSNLSLNDAVARVKDILNRK
jgi:histidyl-tRNA synthetase